MPRLARSVTRCHCGGDSSVRDVARKDTWYVRRVRACRRCGHTWSTAEIPLPMVKRAAQLDAFMRRMRMDS